MATYVKRIKTKQNFIVKIISKIPLYIKTFSYLPSAEFFNVEIHIQIRNAKICTKIQKKSLPKCFDNYFQSVSQTCRYSRFAADQNLTVSKFNKASSKPGVGKLFVRRATFEKNVAAEGRTLSLQNRKVYSLCKKTYSY